MPPAKGYKHSEETKRKISESNKRVWAKRKARVKPSIHVFFGHAARSADPEDECLYCGKHAAVMAYTYFGAPVCGHCWDRKWRKSEDGEHDPPFSRIQHQQSGKWL